MTVTSTAPSQGLLFNVADLGSVRRMPAAATPAMPVGKTVVKPGGTPVVEPVQAPPATPMVTAVLADGSAPVSAGVPVLVAPASPGVPIVLSDAGVLVFDVETTGTDKRRDQIIELCVQFGIGTDAAPAPSRTWRFKPQVDMSPGAQAVHGISLDDLKDCPAFADCADEITAMFGKATVLIGYNLAFDMDMIQAEYERLRRPPVDFSGKTIVDPFRLWQQCEPRSLQHAHQRFVGEKFLAAHSAEADVAATGRVLTGMLTAFGLVDRDWNGIADVCDPQRANWIGPSRHVQWDGDPVTSTLVILSFGKHAGKPLHQLARDDGGYLRWLIDKDFPSHVQELCRAALDERNGDKFHAWVRGRFGAAPVVVIPVS